MITYFTADTHFCHEGILEMMCRPFSSIEEHDDTLIQNINKVVGADDRLFVIGDFAWRAGESARKRISCKNLHLIEGNHDRSSFSKLFKSVEQTTVVKIQGHNVFLSHYPHAFWPASHKGSLHLYGHVHAEREGTLDRWMPARRSMDAGVDNAKRLLGEHRPFSEQEILGFLLPQAGHDPVSWYNTRQWLRNWANGKWTVDQARVELLQYHLDLADFGARLPYEDFCKIKGADPLDPEARAIWLRLVPPPSEDVL